jgi:ABC-type polysaccharide/polyol phosphate export permease
MPSVDTKTIDDWSSLPLSGRRAITRGIDSVIAFIALEKMLVVRGIKMSAAGNISRAFISTVRLFIVINAHIYLYYVIKRPMPGTISFLDYNSTAFALWNVFSSMTHKAFSPAVGAPFNLALNIRWINLFIADFLWELTKALLAVAACYAMFLIFQERSIASVTHLPNMPLVLAMFVLIGVIGGGFGLLLHSARLRWPVIDASMEAMMWFLFVTSGIYESFVALNPLIGDYYRWNPVMVVIEYSRKALDSGYPVGDLNLAYPVVMAGVFLAIGLMLRQSDIRATRP